jgi:hypothetical protein
MPANPLNDLAAVRKLAGKSTFARDEARRVLAEKIERAGESLRLYEPLPYQEAFHSCTAQQCLVQKGNRTGASLSLMVELARAVTGNDPYNKYPKKDGKAAILVYGENHVGRVVYNGLFRTGHFKGFRLIKDLQTGMMRAYHPWPMADGGDLERADESIPHGPLIPKRYIDGKIAWTKRAERVFSVIRFTTGWELYAANSAGDPGQFQGLSIDFYGIDEDMANYGWYEEAQGRVSDVNGKIRWTALPHAKNDDMMKLVDFAERESERSAKENVAPEAVIIRASIYDNKFMSPDYRDKILRGWKSMGDDVYRKRAHGEMDLLSTLMYPTFNRRTHDVMLSPTLVEDQETLRRQEGIYPAEWTAARILAARNGDPPPDWTRYVSIDPGYNILAIEFLCVPPPELGQQIFVYDECYIHEANHVTFGEAMRERCGDNVFEQFIFDFHGGKLRGAAGGEWPIHLYQGELQKHGIRSETTDSGFFPGCDDRKQREEVMRTILGRDRHDQPGLMVVAGKCPSFVTEMEKFRKKTIKQRGKDIPIDEGDRRAGTHAIEAIEMAVALGLEYVKPRRRHVNSSWLDDALTWGDRQRERSERGQRLLHGQNTISLGPTGVRR